MLGCSAVQVEQEHDEFGALHDARQLRLHAEADHESRTRDSGESGGS